MPRGALPRSPSTHPSPQPTPPAVIILPLWRDPFSSFDEPPPAPTSAPRLPSLRGAQLLAPPVSKAPPRPVAHLLAALDAALPPPLAAAASRAVLATVNNMTLSPAAAAALPTIAATALRGLAFSPSATAPAQAQACAALLRAVKPSAGVLVGLKLRQPCPLLLSGVADAVARGGPLLVAAVAGAPTGAPAGAPPPAEGKMG